MIVVVVVNGVCTIINIVYGVVIIVGGIIVNDTGSRIGSRCRFGYGC